MESTQLLEGKCWILYLQNETAVLYFGTRLLFLNSFVNDRPRSAFTTFISSKLKVLAVTSGTYFGEGLMSAVMFKSVAETSHLTVLLLLIYLQEYREG